MPRSADHNAFTRYNRSIRPPVEKSHASAWSRKVQCVNRRMATRNRQGWCVNGNALMTPTFGVLASSETYGHTGWTGTLTFIDPVNHMAIVILGNRPYSAVTDPKVNPNVFVSGLLPSATYGWVVD
ncbi:serine hydrolase [Citrobacter sp. Res13-Sevr-PEB04-36]|uniref:serine hydrolase n=1 Tax=Citrobacter sp. Res13-Sevr-PEB04-36 TaxID=2777960 RepID=UPI001E35ACEF|nr:serine hydrolase [Citrobacter sp. Res13-Sevr-PEB04-36]